MGLEEAINRNPVMPDNTVIAEYMPNGTGAAYALFLNEIKKGPNAKIAVYGDPDIDGLFSGLIAERYLDNLGFGRNNPNYRYFLNSNRAHGFFMGDEELASLKGYLLIAVDFSITPSEYIRILKNGVNLIVLDHHEIKATDYPTNKEYVFSRVDDNYGVILNNQYAAEPEEMRFLSGAGMVYYFFKFVSSQLGIPLDGDTPAIVGITLLSDVREIENRYAYSFLNCTFNMKSEYLKYLQWLVTPNEKSTPKFSPFGVPQMNRSFVDYNFSPIINSMLRADKGYDAMDLLRMIPEKVNTYRYKDYIQVFRQMQKGIIEEIVKEAKEMASLDGSKTRKLSHLSVVCLPNDFILPYQGLTLTNYIGVACPKLKDEDKSGFICVVNGKTGQIIRGSVRGGLDGVDYLKIFQNNGVPCAGHKNAFGILSCNINDINFEKINEDIKEAERVFRESNKTTRLVLQVNNLSAFSSNALYRKLICKYNEYCRDNYRIYLRYTGNFDNVRPLVLREKFSSYAFDNIEVKSFDPSLNVRECLIFPYFENKDYTTYIIKENFEHKVEEENIGISERLTEFTKFASNTKS